MKYRSTRGNVQAESFEDVLFSGYASDGGLFMPERIPLVDKTTLEKWKSLSYLDLSKEVMSLFIPPEEIPAKDLDDLVNKAFSEFGHKDIVSIATVNNFHVLELFYGKTLAFKDYALASVGVFMDYFLSKRKKNVVVLVGTSGDTGSSAIESVKRSKWIDIIVLYPKDRCTQVQELQMTTILEENVHVVRVDGTSDDLDVPIKNCFSNPAYAVANNLCMINSTNWCRILAQTVHLIYAYLRVCSQVGHTVKIVIPSGALGHCTAGSLVNKMGVPVELVCAVNVNDIVHRMISTGDFTVSQDVVATWSSAMDIQVPYNMERLLLLFSDMNYGLVDSLMKEFEEKNSLMIPDNLRQKRQDGRISCHYLPRFQRRTVNDSGSLTVIVNPACHTLQMCEVISSVSVSSDQTLQTMKECWDENQYLLCPHTAVGVSVIWDQRHTTALKTPTVCVATASPAKFSEAVKAAGIEMPLSPQLAQLLTSPTRYTEMKEGDDWDRILRNTIKDISENHSQKKFTTLRP